MEDKHLHKLQEIEVSDPSAEAKQLALMAGLESYKAAHKEASQKNEINPQGFGALWRHMLHLINKLWRLIMKKQFIAATAITSVLAVSVGINLWKSEHASQLSLNPVGGIKKEVALTSSPENVDSSVVSNSIESGLQEVITPPAIDLDQQEIASLASQEEVVGSVASEAFVASAQRTQATKLKQGDRQQKARAIMRPMAEPQGDAMPSVFDDGGNDKFENINHNEVKLTSEEPVSTFSIDVDTSAYAYIRQSLLEGRLPPKDAVRIEEMINYFDYDYPLPESADQPFKPIVKIYPAPWNSQTKLLHIGIKGHDIVAKIKPHSNLVFLLDVSGSMSQANKLPLLKNALRLMVQNLDPEDIIAIVTYAGQAGTVLMPTKVAEKGLILSALENLQSGGSTAGSQGIKQAYALAEQNFDEQGVNRIILATDGDFNVGITGRDELKEFIEHKRESGIFLSVLGFGQGNYNDAVMQTLAENGNGNAAYIDTLNEARKVLVQEASANLFVIAKDVKIQLEFNPLAVAEYRLLGYESRQLRRQDFNNDKVDAGDIGAGHTVTAIYEFTPVGSKARLIDDLRYKDSDTAKQSLETNEFAFLKLRYKTPSEQTSKLLELPITAKMESDDMSSLSNDERFAASVAAFGLKLRDDYAVSNFTFDEIIKLGQNARGEDNFGYRSEFVNMVRLAKSSRGE